MGGATTLSDVDVVIGGDEAADFSDTADFSDIVTAGALGV
jgi:hypothetical protein